MLTVNRQRKEFKKYARDKTMLPADVNAPAQMTLDYYFIFLRHLGFTIIGKEGQQVLVKYPAGWRKIILPNLEDFMYLIDHKGRRRAAIFYKFLGGVTEADVIENKLDIKVNDLKKYKKYTSHINWMPRYVTKVRHIIDMPIGKNPVAIEAHYNSPMIAKVYDQAKDQVLFSTNAVDMGIEHVSSERPDAQVRNAEYSKHKMTIVNGLFAECEEWLQGMFPEYQNISKYWDEV